MTIVEAKQSVSWGEIRKRNPLCWLKLFMELVPSRLRFIETSNKGYSRREEGISCCPREIPKCLEAKSGTHRNSSNMEAPESLNLSLCSKRTLETISPVCAKLGQELEIEFKCDVS
ncbi:unnamed protein product [Caenorhabditis nigoni]